MKQFVLSLIILLAGNLVASVAFSQDASVLGLPALSSTVGENGEATYSLSLQILVLMTVLTVVPVNRIGNDCVYACHHSSLNFKAGPWNSANASQSGFDCDCTLHYLLCNESNF